MPRMSKKDYWKYHKTLRHLWLNHQYLYSYLSPERQWQLHDFFKPAEDIAREQLLEHRQAITKDRPGLPHQAGWALKELTQTVGTFASQPKPKPKATRQRGKPTAKRYKVYSIVRPEIDYDKLADALLMLATHNKHKQ